MPCKNCLGKLEEDTFKTIGKFNHFCGCGKPEFVSWYKGQPEGLFVVSLEEFKQSNILVKNTIDKSNGYLSPFIFDLNCLLEFSKVEIDCIESQMGCPISQVSNFLRLNNIIGGVSVLSVNRLSDELTQERFTGGVMWKKKEGVELPYDNGNVCVIDTFGDPLDVFLRKIYKALVLSMFCENDTFLKVDDRYVSRDEWFIPIGFDYDTILLAISEESDNQNRDEIEITFKNIDNLTIQHGKPLQFNSGEHQFNFSFLNQTCLSPLGDKLPDLNTFIKTINGADGALVEDPDDFDEYLVAKSSFTIEKGTLSIDMLNTDIGSVLQITDDFEFKIDGSDWQISKGNTSYKVTPFILEENFNYVLDVVDSTTVI
tara:strand:+ start:12525 stop:13637 length:1113 start_codon:yes stop_codon:yes gene_type:complete